MCEFNMRHVNNFSCFEQIYMLHLVEESIQFLDDHQIDLIVFHYVVVYRFEFGTHDFGQFLELSVCELGYILEVLVLSLEEVGVAAVEGTVEVVLGVCLVLGVGVHCRMVQAFEGFVAREFAFAFLWGEW